MRFTKDRGVGVESADTLIVQLLSSSLCTEFLMLAGSLNFVRRYWNWLVLGQDVFDAWGAVRLDCQVEGEHCKIDDDARCYVHNQRFAVGTPEHIVGDARWR